MRGFLLLIHLVTVLAQVGPQATLLPACIKSCDPAAIASVNCTNADQLCHCQRQTGILSNISACANKTCPDPSYDLYIFTTLFGQVCAPFNITVPVIGSNSTANMTASPSPSASASASTSPVTNDANYASDVSSYMLMLSSTIGLVMLMQCIG